MEKQGYTLQYQNDGYAILKGDFAGKSDCSVIVMSTDLSNVVWMVIVEFPEKVSWISLKSEYETFKESYTNKYGQPISYEYFSDPYYEGDGYELNALRNKKCKYVSLFTLPQGSVILSMADDPYVMVFYQDGINAEISEKESNQLIIDDI